VIVEGQADAITLGQWGMAAMATSGTAWTDHAALFKVLKERHSTIYIAMDADEAGQKVITGKDGDFPLADVLGPMLRVVAWDEKDANDQLKAWAVEGMAQDDQVKQVRDTLDQAEPIVVRMARYAGGAQGARRDQAVERTIRVAARMDGTRRAMYRAVLADLLKVGIREFNNLVAAERKVAESGEEGEGPKEFVETLGGWFPVEDGKRGWLIEYMFEQKTGRGSLAFRDPDGRIGSAPYLDIDGIRYTPMEDEIINAGGVLFASELGAEKSTKELVATIELFLKRYFLLDNPFEYRLASYYVLLTWLFDCFSAIPYLRAQGDTNTGKSEFMLRVGHLCYRLVISTGASSTAALKFALDVFRGTIFMDEMDIADRFDERMVILNVGAMKDQAKVWNMVETKTAAGTRGFRGVMANVYGPKLITMYGGFRDPATEGRCLTFKMVEHETAELVNKNIPLEKTEEFYREAAHIRNLLLRWRLGRWQARIEISKELIDVGVSTRINQVTGPLKELAREDPELMRDIQTFVHNLSEELTLERSMTKVARVLDAIVAILEEEDYAKYLLESEVDGYVGEVKFVYYKHLAEVTNKIMDDMNIGEEKLVEEETTEGGEAKEDGKGKRKKFKYKEVTSQSIGWIARKDLRLPVKRMGKGFVVILDLERIEMLKLKYGLNDGFGRKANGAAKKVEPREAEQGELL
jgi:hypothetical protein